MKHALFILLMGTAWGCSTFSGKSFLPTLPGYTEKEKEVFVLKKRLLEISGLVALGHDSIAAINDEKGELFLVDLYTNQSHRYKFGGKNDYEELVRTDSFYYVLQSDGDIVEVGFPPVTNATTYKYPKDEKKTEFESMVWYREEGKLVLIAKDQRNRRGGIYAYSFDLHRKEFDTAPYFELPLRSVFRMMKDDGVECKPSGAALHPFTGRLYIVASVGKLLLICSPEGKLESIFQLNPAQFPQPEGISFAANGDLYISNEGLNGKATVIKFPYTGQ